MSAKKDRRCRRCLEPIQGNSELCVSCFRDLVVPCSACLRRTPSGRLLPRMDDRRQVVHCEVCRDQRWVVRDYTPGEAAKKR